MYWVVEADSISKHLQNEVIKTERLISGGETRVLLLLTITEQLECLVKQNSMHFPNEVN